ncbi:MAG: hypothetical protein JWO88_3601 [Frankiales bacterium]|nr:hypothetical protein [Frankiales bacterium]
MHTEHPGFRRRLTIAQRRTGIAARASLGPFANAQVSTGRLFLIEPPLSELIGTLPILHFFLADKALRSSDIYTQI